MIRPRRSAIYRLLSLHAMRVLLLLCAVVLSAGRPVYMEEKLDMCVMPATRVIRLALTQELLYNTAFEWGEHHDLSGWHYERLSDAAARNLAMVQRSKRLQLADPLECVRVKYSVLVHMPKFAVTYLSLKNSHVTIEKDTCTADGMLFESVFVSGMPLLHEVTITGTATFAAGEMYTTTTAKLHLPLLLSWFHGHVAALMRERWHRKSAVFVRQICA